MRACIGTRAQTIRPSATLELAARARELREAGEVVVDLSAGEPDVPTPAPIVEAAHQALKDGHFKYTPTAGIASLRRAVAASYGKRLAKELGPEHVVITNGAKQALYNAIATATDPGDRVGILRPYWGSYVEQVRVLGCEPVWIDCPAEAEFRPDLEQLRGALQRGLRLLIANSPCNPTGAAWSEADWEPILEALAEHETLLLSDEIYEDIVYADEGHVSPLRLRPELLDRCCLVSGLSKAYAMTGWRLGYSIAPAPWSRAMAALQGHVTSNVNAITQQAALTALRRPELVAPMLQTFRRRRDLVLRLIREIPGVAARPPEGAFYLYLDVRNQLQRSTDSHDVDALARRLLDEHRLVLVPGSAFGDPHHLRLSFAASDQILEEGFVRLSRALA
jgi:aspartate aminotransferase